MIISKRGRFVYFATPKTASTSVETCLRPFATLALSEDPSLKHMGVRKYRKVIEPILESIGVKEKLETYAVVREPIEWLFSWYRYRTRKEIPNKENSTSHLTFNEFVESYLQSDPPRFAKVGNPCNQIYLNGKKEIGVDHVIAYDRITELVEILAARLDTGISLDMFKNVSPQMEMEISAANYKALENYFSHEMGIYQNALDQPRRITAA